MAAMDVATISPADAKLQVDPDINFAMDCRCQVYDDIPIVSNSYQLSSAFMATGNQLAMIGIEVGSSQHVWHRKGPGQAMICYRHSCVSKAKESYHLSTITQLEAVWIA